MLFVMIGTWGQLVVHRWEGKGKNMVGAQHLMETQNKKVGVQPYLSEGKAHVRTEGWEKKLQLEVSNKGLGLKGWRKGGCYALLWPKVH